MFHPIEPPIDLNAIELEARRLRAQVLREHAAKLGNWLRGRRVTVHGKTA